MESRLGKDHRHFRSRMDAIVQNMFEINYSHLIQYEILEKLVTFIWVDMVIQVGRASHNRTLGKLSIRKLHSFYAVKQNRGNIK